MSIPQSGRSSHVDPSLPNKGEGLPSSEHTALVNEILNGAAPFPDAYRTRPLPQSPKNSDKPEGSVPTKPQEKIPIRNFKEKMSNALGDTVKELKALKGAIRSTFNQAYHTGLKTLGKDKSEKDVSPLGASHDYNIWSEDRDLTPRGAQENKRKALYVDDIFTTPSSTSVAHENPSLSSSTADSPVLKKENIPSDSFVPSPNGSAAKLLSKLDKSSYEMRSVSSELSEKDRTALAEKLLGDKDYIFIIQKGSAEVDTKVLVFFNKSRPLLGKGVEIGDALSKDVNDGFVSPYVLPFAITPHVEETVTILNSNLEIKEGPTTESQTPTSTSLAHRSIKKLTDYIRRPIQVNSETTEPPLNFNENPLFTGPDGEWEPPAAPLMGEPEQTPERESSSPLGELPTPSNRQKAPSTAERASIDQPTTVDNLYQKTKAAEKTNQSPLQTLYARSRREKPSDIIAASTVPFIATSGVLTSKALKEEKIINYEIVKADTKYSEAEVKMLARDKLNSSDVVLILRSDASLYLYKDGKKEKDNPNWDKADRVEVFFKGNPSEGAQTSAAKVALALLKDELGLSDEELISKIHMEKLS